MVSSELPIDRMEAPPAIQYLSGNGVQEERGHRSTQNSLMTSKINSGLLQQEAFLNSQGIVNFEQTHRCFADIRHRLNNSPIQVRVMAPVLVARIEETQHLSRSA